jgi:hypothetical protein
VRTRYIGIALCVLVVLAIGAAMWWRSTSTQPARVSQDRPGAVPIAQAPSSELVLQVNRMTAATIAAGASAFFTVTLTGAAPEPWTSALRFETSGGKPLPFRIEPLGSPFTLRADEGQQETSEMRQTEFGISPEEAGRMSAGSHTIRAVLALDRSPSDGRPLVSNTVTLIVGASEADASPSGEKDRLESAARFSLLSEKWDDAHRVALRLVEREDADTSVYILLGDALNGLRRDDEALAAYHEALASLPKDLDESPDYLIARMEEVQRRLEAANAKK